jgi:transcriptional regulator with XRE-family HTH domain
MYVKDGTKIRRRRRDKGLSQVQLAALARCTQQYISLIEQGLDRDISEKLAERICTYLDISLDDYFEERRSAVRAPDVATNTRGAGNRVPA